MLLNIIINIKKMTIREKFNTIEEKHQDWSTMVCFTEAIRNTEISRVKINSWLNKLVDKEDYASNEKGKILDFLEEKVKKEQYEEKN